MSSRWMTRAKLTIFFPCPTRSRRAPWMRCASWWAKACPASTSTKTYAITIYARVSMRATTRVRWLAKSSRACQHQTRLNRRWASIPSTSRIWSSMTLCWWTRPFRDPISWVWLRTTITICFLNETWSTAIEIWASSFRTHRKLCMTPTWKTCSQIPTARLMTRCRGYK